jgi:hypothetical protein
MVQRATIVLFDVGTSCCNGSAGAATAMKGKQWEFLEPESLIKGGFTGL